MKHILMGFAGAFICMCLAACGSSSKSAEEVAIEHITNCFGGKDMQFVGNARGVNGSTLGKERLEKYTQDIVQLRSFAQIRGGLKSVSVLKSGNAPSNIYKNLTQVELKVEFNNGEVIDSIFVRVALIGRIWRVLLDYMR